MTGHSFISRQADSYADRKRAAWGPGADPHATSGFGPSRILPAPRASEAEEVIVLGSAAVRLVPVDRREALGIMDVLCRQSSVQNLRVRPRLGKPGRQSCMSCRPRSGAGGGLKSKPAWPEPGSEVRRCGWGHARTGTREQRPGCRRGGTSNQRLSLRVKWLRKLWHFRHKTLDHPHYPLLHQEMPRRRESCLLRAAQYSCDKTTGSDYIPPCAAQQ